VTRPHLAKVPPDYRRRQTLANAERFVTDELSSLEEKISLAEERARAFEVHLFDQAVEALRGAIPRLRRSAVRSPASRRSPMRSPISISSSPFPTWRIGTDTSDPNSPTGIHS